MDLARLDHLSRSLATAGPRRRLLGLLAAVPLVNDLLTALPTDMSCETAAPTGCWWEWFRGPDYAGIARVARTSGVLDAWSLPTNAGMAAASLSV